MKAFLEIVNLSVDVVVTSQTGGCTGVTLDGGGCDPIDI